MASAYTMHACSTDGQMRCSGTNCGDNGVNRFKGVCDKNGCDIQPHRLGVHNFFGPGSDFQVDSTKPVQVTTQFITNDSTDHGKLVEVNLHTSDISRILHLEICFHSSCTVLMKIDEAKVFSSYACVCSRYLLR